MAKLENWQKIEVLKLATSVYLQSDKTIEAGKHITTLCNVFERFVKS